MGKHRFRIIEKDDSLEELVDGIINQEKYGRIEFEPDNETWTMYDDKGKEIGSTKSWQVKEREAADRISLEKGTSYHHPDGRIFDNGTGNPDEDVPIDFNMDAEESNEINIQFPNKEMKEEFQKQLELDNKAKQKLLGEE